MVVCIVLNKNDTLNCFFLKLKDKGISVLKVSLFFYLQQFVTRAVRVVDLITNLDMAAFQAQGGLSTFINRLEVREG